MSSSHLETEVHQERMMFGDLLIFQLRLDSTGDKIADSGT
jgi:hypothetical protein